MLYDDEKCAELTVIRYFMNGFEKGQSCIYFTDQDSKKTETMLSEQECLSHFPTKRHSAQENPLFQWSFSSLHS